MPDKLVSTVRSKTALSEGYRKHAAYQSMDTFIADWEEAAAILSGRIATLRELRAERANEVVRGEWPRDSGGR